LNKSDKFGALFSRSHKTDKKLLRFTPRVSEQGFFWALTHTEKSC